MNQLEQIKTCVGQLIAAVNARSAAEQKFEQDFTSCVDPTTAHLRESVQALKLHQAEQCRRVENDAAARRDVLQRDFESDALAVRNEYESVSHEIELRYGTELAEIAREQADARWMVTSLLDDDSEANPKYQLRTFKSRLTATRKRLRDQRRAINELIQSAIEVMVERRQWRAFSADAPSRLPRDCQEALEFFQAAEKRIREACDDLRKQQLPRIFVGFRAGILFLLAWAPLFMLLHRVDPAVFHSAHAQFSAQWTMNSAGISATVAFLGLMILFGLARSASGIVFQEISDAENEMKAAHARWLEFARLELKEQEQWCEAEYSEIAGQRQTSLAKIDGRAAKREADWSTRRQAERADADVRFPALLCELTANHDRQLAQIESDLQRQISVIEEHYRRQIEFQTKQAEATTSERATREETARCTISGNWSAALTQFVNQARHVNEQARRETPDWMSLENAAWNLPDNVAASIPLGTFRFDLTRLANGHTQDHRLSSNQTEFVFPFRLPFPGNLSLLLKTRGEGRAAAVRGLKTLMLRLLTSLPAGKVRFTIIDPVGLGEEFSAFMHLADFDPQIIGTRIWTQTPHIEARLTEISEHIENVFQAYLRNEFATIEEYNQHAGEVAEPYHFVIVANFPTNFSEAAARRLVSIASSGPRCGVYPILSVDTAASLPHNCNLEDFETGATTFAWNNGSFHLLDRDVSWLPFSFEEPPRAEAFTEIVRSAGRQSKHSRRVEVPFERIAPRDGHLWHLDSRTGIDVPLGRAGATKLQHLRLGQGTSQHVLIAGKTGSGKSTFLHTLITNLALNYSPHEVEFFLIDFKKGVEFKTYATHSLAHARIIGIESDREFGVSVLERLDGVLKERGELFRRHGVNDIESFRKTCPGDRLQRLLLVVDEFQEFFVEDDSLSQSAGLLLDRLVRQGRAFGIHVLLGSQTLGGAYSLARSTLGQVAVRIALQCSESDAHLILSEENTAARLLSRPGEAIYNDANGLLDGNHPFQIAWLPDFRREEYLREIQQKALGAGIECAPAIVFEGNIPSDPRRNGELSRALSAVRAGTDAVRSSDYPSPTLWLGEAVSIKAPTSIRFRRRPGDNLLIVGQDAGSAQGLLAVSFVALAAQVAQNDSQVDDGAAQFYILDGDEGESNAAVWQQLSAIVPQRSIVAGSRSVTQAIATIAEIVSRRTEANRNDDAPVFVLISNLSRLRELKGAGDDFGFGSFDSEKAATPDRQLIDILRDGPAVGVHIILWCDTCSNLNRWLTSQAQREFEMRIAFQMNATDSSNLIDSPAASRLGLHRAILSLHETGQCEKFRPYAVPSPDWLTHVASCFQADEPVLEACDNLSAWTIV